MPKNTTPRTTPKKERRRRATPAQRLLTMRQISEETGIPVRTLYSLHVRGLLPAVQFIPGGQKWFRRMDVDAMIDRHLERVG
jgi:hypothetical protein